MKLDNFYKNVYKWTYECLNDFCIFVFFLTSSSNNKKTKINMKFSTQQRVRENSISIHVSKIFASELNKAIDTEYLISFANQIQPSFLIVFNDADLDEVNFFKGKYSESTMGKILAKNLAENFSMKLRGSSSEILTKTKSTTIIINTNNERFGNNYQRIDSDKVCASIVLSIKEISSGLL